MAKYLQGKYQPKNPRKYAGDPTDCVYRSSWELRAFIAFDENPSIIQWSSENVVIPYYWEADGKMHRYFVDLLITAKTKNGNKTFLIEIKPLAQTKQPTMKKGKRQKTYLNEVATYTKNQAKWAAAREYCKKKGWEFLIMTEEDLFPKGKTW